QLGARVQRPARGRRAEGRRPEGRRAEGGCEHAEGCADRGDRRADHGAKRPGVTVPKGTALETAVMAVRSEPSDMLPGPMDRANGPAPSCGSRRTGIERVGRHRPVVDVVVPVFNEEEQLAASIRRFRRYLDTRFPLAARITIADNASTDSTWWIARRLEAELEGVRAMHLDEKGRGRAL